jgi:hypothetical protein
MLSSLEDHERPAAMTAFPHASAAETRMVAVSPSVARIAVLPGCTGKTRPPLVTVATLES